MTIRVQFGTASNGWLSAAVEIAGSRYPFDISYTPNDFVLDLVAALSQALSYPGTYVATVHEEPVESDWTFQRIQDAAVFSIIEYPDLRRMQGTGRKQVETSGSALDLVLPFWRGLRELESRAVKEHFNTHWRRAFPTTELEKLTAQIERLKLATPD